MSFRNSVLSAAFAVSVASGALAQTPANAIDCGTNATGQPLVTLPEIQSSNGALRGTLYTVSEQVRMRAHPVPADPAKPCIPQWVRAYRRSAPANWNPSSQTITDPLPGPILRAKLGDLVQLTFLNVIDASKFPGVDDNRCDQTNVYPSAAVPDQYPDCFAGSVFTNVHFHGAHVNPNSTGDNVFLQIRPSPRRTDGTNAPVITASAVQPAFDEFFAQCSQELKDDPGPKIWPRVWSDVRPALQSVLMDPLQQYAPAWWTANQNLIRNGDWPQYYIGAYPYCFKLPRYTAPAATSTASPDVRTPHTHGAGQAEVDEAKAPNRPLIMGQAPGTHWYHAHKHGSTTINVMNGMTGAFIIEGAYDDDLNAFYGPDWTRRQPVMVIQQLGAAPSLLTNTRGAPGPDFSVNGRVRPIVSMPGGSVQMWRIANTSGRAGVYFTAPTRGLQWRRLAVDGVQLHPDNYWNSLNQPFLLASGNRSDLLVQAPKFVENAKNDENRYQVLVYNTVDPADRPPMKAAAPITLLTVVVTKDAPMELLPKEKAPRFPPFLEDVTDDQITGTKVLTFATGPAVEGGKSPPSRHTIDGKLFDGELGAVVALNRAEEWKIVNDTYAPKIAHPFHIHVNPFQITEIFEPNALLPWQVGAGKVAVTPSADKKSATVTPAAGTSLAAIRVDDWLLFDSTPAMNAAQVTAVAADSLTINVAPNAALQNVSYRTAIPLYTADASTARPGQCAIDLKNPKPCGPTTEQTNRIWWDVFPIPSGRTFGTTNVPGYFKMRSKFVDFPGYFVLHCHILAHEDRGMMTVVEVAPLQTPYSHH